MPVYEYQCMVCGHVMEQIQKITDPPLTKCPACHKPGLARLIGKTSFVLKGKGWASDGYSSKSK